jgi:hypothetical protein
MTIRVALIAIAAAISAVGAGAQPDKEQPQAKAPATAPAPVVLASSSEVRRPSQTSDRSAATVRQPAPRVTICRCGDQQPADEQPDE